MSRRALITGVAGQDGSYLAELLLSEGYTVIGTSRDAERAGRCLPEAIRSSVQLEPWDLLDAGQLTALLTRHRPQEIYNLAAFSSGAGMYDEPASVAAVNGMAVTHLLETIRHVDPTIRLCQASSSELFGNPPEAPQTEHTPMAPRSPYGAAKLYAHWMIRIYRERYRLFACSAILFNHESPRRGLQFVTRKVSYEVARIRRGLSDHVALGNLDARRDWGYAGDYVRAMWLMLRASQPQDYVVATGRTHSIRELCQQAFACVGMDYLQYVRASHTHLRPAEPIPLVGDASNISRDLGWTAAVSFAELIRAMVEADLQRLDERQAVEGAS